MTHQMQLGDTFKKVSEKDYNRLHKILEGSQKEAHKWRISYFTLKKKYEDLLRSLQKGPDELPPMEWGK